MKELVILSGKGGSGKTTVAAALADLASKEHNLVLVDADVDASNLELLLSPKVRENHTFQAGETAVIDPAICTACGRCLEVCRFEAILPGDAYRVSQVACEGCASCFYQCPAEAIRMVASQAGEWYRSDTPAGPLFHAQLYAGQENSGKLVTLIKQQARAWGRDREAEFVFLDGPPGIGCPVIAASTGVTLALIVTEPTVSGLHDLWRALATAQHFGVPAVVCVNKVDLNPRRSAELTTECRARGLPIVGRLPFDHRVTEAMVNGVPITQYADCEVSREIAAMWPRLRDTLAGL